MIRATDKKLPSFHLASDLAENFLASWMNHHDMPDHPAAPQKQRQEGFIINDQSFWKEIVGRVELY